MDFGLLAPALIGGIVGVLGFAALLWMNANRPTLQLPTAVASEEEPDLPFEQPTPEEQEKRRLISKAYDRIRH